MLIRKEALGWVRDWLRRYVGTYGDHAEMEVEVWMESDSDDLHTRVECKGCGSVTISSFIALGGAVKTEVIKSLEESSHQTAKEFKTWAPASCEEAALLNAVRDVMLS